MKEIPTKQNTSEIPPRLILLADKEVLKKAISDTATVGGIEEIVEFLPVEPIYGTALNLAILNAVNAKFGEAGIASLNKDRTIFMRLYLVLTENSTTVTEAEADQISEDQNT